MATVDRIQGLSSSLGVKAPVACATTGPITLNGLQTVDGVALAAGDRVLVKNQADSTANGIYDASTSDWSRSLDFNKSNDVVKGTLVLVAGGTVSTGFAFVVSGANPIVPGTSMLAFSPSGVAAELPLTVAEGGTGATTAADARGAISAAKSGENADITRLDGLSTPLLVAQGGTGANTQAAALTAMGAALNGILTKTANYTAVAADRGKLIDYTSGTYNLALLAAATAGDGFVLGIKNSGTGVLTIDPSAAELIDGVATIALAAGESCLAVCNGTAWKTVGKNSSGGKLLRVTRLSTPGSGTWTKPADVTRITIKAVGGGGGGGNIISSNPSGAGGGAGGYGEIDIASPAASYAYTVGAGGAGRASYSAGAGGNGGSTTIAGITALPGDPGPATNGAPGIGGWCSGGDVNYYGGMGPSAGWQHGGASHFAPGGFGSTNVTNAVAGSRGSGGGGGGGSGVGYSSGAGGAGYIEIWEYA